jgi:phenylacetate-CoA ligase
MTRLLAVPPDRSQVWEKRTSGTSGPPVSFYYSTEYYLEQVFLSIPKLLVRHGALDLASRPVVALHLTDTPSGSWIKPYPARGRGVLCQVVIGTDPCAADEIVEILTGLRPAIVTARPEIIGAFLRNAPMIDLSTLGIELLLLSGSTLSHDRGFIERRAKCVVTEAYGLTEFGVVAAGCSEGEGVHLDSSLVYGEVVDHETGAPTEQGHVGELILSGTSNSVMPLVRYRTGDFARMLRDECRCGSADPRVEIVQGRSVPLFRFPSGTFVAPTMFNDLFDLFPLSEFEVVQESEDFLRVRLQPRRNAVATCSGVSASLRARLPDDVRVEVEAVPRIEKGRRWTRYRVAMGPRRVAAAVMAR